MVLQPIIVSLLENDMYKFSMGQAIYHQFPDYRTTWTFKCRNTDVHFTKDMVQEIKDQIKAYCNLRFTEDELAYLSSIKWIKPSYVNFLRLWHPNFSDFMIEYNPDPDTCNLSIETAGTWLNTSMYEVPVLAIVNEVYFRMQYNYDELFESYKRLLQAKLKQLLVHDYIIGNFSEFGLRRRLSGEAQDYLIANLWEFNEKESNMKKLSYCVGTSNVYLAKKYCMTPCGTQAHEWVMCVGQGNHKHNPAYSNWYAMEHWVKEYGILNGTALTDTITTDCFLCDFNLTYATLFSGVRHDSGDPIAWGRKIIDHYKSLGIDPKTKTLLFSDSLNFHKADSILSTFRRECKVAFGIGTYLSNDTDFLPLNIVMKVTECNDSPVAKLSDVEGKGMCKDRSYEDYLNRSIDWRLSH